MMADIQKSVFISYRRVPGWPFARLIFDDLRAHDFDVFMDYEGIDAGTFDTILLNQIAARAHFVLVLTPGTVDRFKDKGDWLRREIEHAMDLERNIVPVKTRDFDYEAASPFLVGKLKELSRFNATTLEPEFFDASMKKLRTRFLKPAYIPLAAAPPEEQAIVENKIKQIASYQAEPLPTSPEPVIEPKNPLEAISLQILAQQQIQEHNIDSALRLLQRAYQFDPEDLMTNYLLGYFFASRKREFDLAQEHLEHALEIDPEFAPAVGALGLVLRRKGDGEARPGGRRKLWAAAELKLLDALDLDPNLVDADGESYYGTLGGLYRRQQRYNEAIEMYEQALEVTPESSYPITNLATLHKHQGNDEEATYYFQRVLRATELRLQDDPRDHWARADYAQAKLILGYKDDAIAELFSVIELEPEPSRHVAPGLDHIVGRLKVVGLGRLADISRRPAEFSDPGLLG